MNGEGGRNRAGNGGGWPPHVLLVTNEYPPEKTAGTAMSTQFLAEELTGRGCRVTIAVNTRGTAPSRESSGALEVLRLRPLPLPMTRMAQRVAMLGRIAHRIRPDVIQGQSLSCGFLAYLAGRPLGIPSVVYVQGLDLYEAGCPARWTYIRWALKRCDAVVAVTHDLRSIALSLSGRAAEVIPHGLRMRGAHRLRPQEARSRLDLPQGARIVLFVGRLIRLKGVEYLIRAMPQVIEACPDARLVLVGEGEERPGLQALTRSLGLDGRITFAGGRAHEDVIGFMRAADVFVLPSLVESFGIVLVEAMSCGLPIVASNVMGIPSLIEDGVNGVLVPPGDTSALAGAITRLLADPPASAGMARANARKAANYAMPRVADQFLALWGSLVDPQTHRMPTSAQREGPWTTS